MSSPSNIVMIEEGRPQLCAVYLPALDELFYGKRGQGAWHEVNGNPTRLPVSRQEEPTLARARFHDNQTVERFAVENHITHNVKMSSAVRLPRLAQGVVNLVLTSNRASEWDVAAGHLLVNETGGTIQELHSGQEPVYNKPNIKSAFLLATDQGMARKSWIIPEIENK